MWKTSAFGSSIEVFATGHKELRHVSVRFASLAPHWPIEENPAFGVRWENQRNENCPNLQQLPILFATLQDSGNVPK